MLERMHSAKATSDELKSFYNSTRSISLYILPSLPSQNSSHKTLQIANTSLFFSRFPARAAIEEDYARKLLQLSRKALGSAEAGSLRASLDVVRGEVESMGKAHGQIAQQMRAELEEPLAAFSGGLKERRKIVQNGIEKLIKIKGQQTSSVNKVGFLVFCRWMWGVWVSGRYADWW